MHFCARGSKNGGKESGFNTTDGYVNHGEDVGVALGNGKWTNNVLLDMGKKAFWNGNGKGRRETWPWIFSCWQESHSWDHYSTLEDIWDQTKWEEMSQYVALNPGWPA